ncbi:MAG: carbohydrate ABC transporter permease [Rhodospirillales bacterium]|nr:carbohydrate ABC transporter permease [Rhodospirillales bacterium]
MGRRSIRGSVLCWLVLLPLIVLVLFPFALMLSTALKSAPEVLQYPPRWLPAHIDWSTFAAMWKAAGFGTAVLNSFAISTLATALALAVSVPAAYALARLPFAAERGYRRFLLVTQMLSPVLLVLGLFRMAASVPFGSGTLVNTRLVVIVIYATFNIAFSVWMLAAYFAAIPRDLEEAAWIDGCTKLRGVIAVFLPLAVPAIAVTAIVTFVNEWNEFTVALTMLRSPEKQTITLRVVNLVAGRYSVEWNQVMAATLVATGPVALLFAWLQRYLVGGLTLGAVK